MKNQKIWQSFVLIIVFFVFIFFINNKFGDKSKHVEIGGVTLKTEIVSTSESQEFGLSNRKSLGEDEGMLFVFENSGIYSFWMKDMNFPIDMIWIDKNLKIVFIKKNATPESYPETFSSSTDALYVLEVVSGFSDKYNLKIGDSVLLK